MCRKFDYRWRGRRDILEFRLDLRVKIEERFQARPQLFLDIFFTAFQNVHGDVGISPILQLDCSVTHFEDFLGGQ